MTRQTVPRKTLSRFGGKNAPEKNLGHRVTCVKLLKHSMYCAREEEIKRKRRCEELHIHHIWEVTWLFSGKLTQC